MRIRGPPSGARNANGRDRRLRSRSLTPCSMHLQRRAEPPPGAHGTRGARSYGGGERADPMRYVQFCFSYLKPLAGSAVLCDTAMQRQPVTESTGKPDAIRATSKMSLISSISMRSVSDIKLIRTDTTLDLSQKAEKVCVYSSSIIFLFSFFGSSSARNIYAGQRSVTL